MSAKTIKSALGLLQDDPDDSVAWQRLRTETAGDTGMSAEELGKLLVAARRAHESRREHEAVAKLLAIEVAVARGTGREADLQADLAHVLDEDVLDDSAARAAYKRLLELRPSARHAAEAIERAEAKRAKWREVLERYVQEAQASDDDAFKSSMLVSAAEIAWRFGRGGDGSSAGDAGSIANVEDHALKLLRDAVQHDARNQRAETLLERILAGKQQYDELSAAMHAFATAALQKDEKVAAWTRLGRTLAKKANAPDRAAAAFARVVELSPGHSEASSFLADHYTSREKWDELVALYEAQVHSGTIRGRDEQVGAFIQIAMVQWRMRGRPDAAEPWFEKVRKVAPAHPGMLAFFRELCAARGESGRLATILGEAQRGMSDGPERAALVVEVAKLSEEGANAHKAIEQWRSVLRQDPKNAHARDSLKRLYRQTSNWNALTDMLRQDLDKVASDDARSRLSVLREVSAVYREQVKSDSALVTVLTQIVQIDPTDIESVRELARVYESLQRWRDLLTMQARQADLEKDAATKAELWRAIARRWFEQFSNVQNAVEAYEKLHALAPGDREAVDRLTELYSKRRAYKPLYDLMAQQADACSAGAQRRALWTEMAKIAAERLDMGAQAVTLYKRVLEEEPSSQAALDALEKQAERDKDFATVADVLERRASIAGDDAARLIVLQKLGSIYGDRLHDHANAMAAWRRVLAIQPGHAKALRVLRDGHLALGDYDGLKELYAQSGDWEGLAEVLSGAADKASDAKAKVDLSFRCADLYVNELRAPERAFRAYERVLSVRPDDLRAASALVSIYEKEGKHNRLPALYEVLAGHARDIDDKLALLAKLVRVCGDLHDGASAFAWARKAYELAPDREGALGALEEAARSTAQWQPFADTLSARIAAVDSGPPSAASAAKKKGRRKPDNGGDAAGKSKETRALRAKLAEVYAREMGRVAEAVATYRAIVEEDESDELAVQTLDQILRAADLRDDLRWLLDLRVARANTAHKLELLADWAMLEEEAFGAADRATALYRRVLEIVPTHGPALRALARLLRAQGDAAGAVDVLLADRDQRQGAERAAREIEIARLYADPLRRAPDALAACERALAILPDDPRAIEVLEQLLPMHETRARAAAMLERSYEQTGAFAKQAEVLQVLVATAAARDDRLALAERLADVRGEKLGDADGAFEVIARMAEDFPTELRVWDRLAVLAQQSGRAQALVDALVAVLPPTGATSLPEHVEIDLAERAATLLDEKIGDVDRARPYLERMLARQPDNDRAFLRLKQILTTREQWDALGDLYERAVVATTQRARRAELLAEIALVAEEITGDRPKAIAYYERILDVDPTHEQAIRSLDALYSAEQRWEMLAQLLRRRLQSAAGDDKLDLEQRLGTLLFAHLGDASGALACFEGVLRERPNADEARQIVEKMISLPELRARAAIVLEAVYTARDEVSDLVRVLEVRLEFASGPDEMRDSLRRVAELRDERLRDDAGALEAFARLLPMAPDDARARERMLEIARRLGQHERAAAVLTEAAAAAKAPMPRAEILGDVARLFENQLDDAARAERVYRQVLDLAPDAPEIALPACRALERIYVATADNQRLVDVLRIEVKLEGSGDMRREIRGRIGDLCETVLGDASGAIEAWRARLDDDPADTQALAALDRLYERSSQWRELVEVLRARERMADDKNDRRTLLARIATTLADKLTDVGDAISAYRAIVDDFGADRASLASLATLYEIADRWQDLVDTLESDLALAETAHDKLAILVRLGAVRQNKLGDVAAAVESYRHALSIDPANIECRAALEGLLESESARREAAAILRPLYEVDGQYDKLLRVLELQSQIADSTGERLALVAQASSIAEGPLGNAALALEYAARGLRGAAAEPDLPGWIERCERLAAATGKFADLVQLLRGVVADVLDGDLQLDVTLRIADVARSRLGDVALAKQHYAKALEARGDDRRALVALESLHEETGDFAALLDIVKRRSEVADGDAERKQLLYKQARLSDEKLGDAHAAISTYEQILDLGLDAEALCALERLYASTERWEDLVALYERQIGAPDVTSERKAALHHALGDVVRTRMGEMDRAFDQYAAALALDPKHPQTVFSLEALMSDPDRAARAAEMLEPVYMARLDWRRVMATIGARLDASQDPDERRQLLRRLAKMYEEQEEDYRAAMETTAKLLAEDLTDEATWAELERLARVASGEGRLAEIFAGELAKVTADEPATARLAKRTGELFEQQKDVERALSFYRRAHAFDPEANDGTFEALDRLLRDAGRARDRVQLHRSTLEFKNDPRERLAVLHAIARLEDAELHDDAAAIETYRAALDVADDDTHALESLARLYAHAERWRDLADLTRRRAEQSALPEDEARFRMDLAKLMLEHLSEAQGAIDELQAVVELAPPAAGGPGAEAVSALEALLPAADHKARVVDILRPIYERADDWRHLVAINDERLCLATDDGERISILRETADLWERRGSDLARAFQAMNAAWTLDPQDGGARADLERLAAATRQWDALADAYEKVLERADGATRRELLAALAELHDKRRDDPRRSLEAWSRLSALDEGELQPLQEMDALATLLSDWPTLVRVLIKKAALLSDDEARASTWRRVGEAKRDMLDDVEGAIEAYERALEIEPQSAFTIDHAIELYEKKNDAARLVDLYRRRVDLCGEDDEALRYELLVGAAARYEKDLDDRREAIDCLGQALATRPGDGEALRRLDALFTHEKMWPDLLENLKLQAASATQDGLRCALQKRIGALYAGQLQDARAALETYRDVLFSGFDVEAESAVHAIGERHEDLRAEATDVLEPVLRAGGRHAELAAVLELRLRAQTESADRAKTLRAIADVAESALDDPERAQSALLRAVAEEPRDAALHADIERIAGRVGKSGWESYAEALDERGRATFEAEIAADLFVRLGRVCEEKLDDAARAAKAYMAASERMGDDRDVLAALDRLLARLGDTKALADVLERRIAVEAGAPVQADLLHRLAGLQIREFGERAQGLSNLRQAIERVADHAPSREALEALLADDALFQEAFEALESVHRALGRHEDLAKLYERRVARAQSTRDRTRARLDLARVLEDSVGDRGRAQRVVEAAVIDDPSDVDALSDLQRLAPTTGGWRQAADALSDALEAPGMDLPAATRTELYVRLASWQKDELSDARGAEQSYAKALAIDAENLEVLRAIERIRRVPGRERDLIDTLRARARLETDLGSKRDLLREAKTLAETTVGDRDLAEAALRDLVQEHEGDLWALEELTRLREAAGDYAEVVELLTKRAELESDGQQAMALKHRAADVLRGPIGDAARAIATYEEILDTEPTDAAAGSALRALYTAAGRNGDLARLLQRLIDVASTPDRRAALRLDLAKLQSEGFAALNDAIETLRAILDEDAPHAEAVVALSRLYEKTERDAELAELLKSQIDGARERDDAQSELSLLVRLGDLQETRLGDATAAQETYEQVLARDPSHRGALEAAARIGARRADWERAAAALSKLVDLAGDPSGVPWALKLAEAREKMGDAAGVEEALQRGLRLEPSNAGLRAMLRARWERADRWTELAELLVGDADLIAAAHGPSGAGVEVAVTDPVAEQVKLLRRAAEIHLQKRSRAQDAIPVLERAAQLVPHDRELLLALCDAYNAAERERDAAVVLERVIASFGGRRTKELAVYHHRLARALKQLGDRDVALAQLDMAFKIDPGSVPVLKDLGVLALENNDLDRAQKTFRALLLQRLDDKAGISKGEVFFYLGEISVRQGDKAKAVQMFERAVENDPALQQARAKLAELKS